MIGGWVSPTKAKAGRKVHVSINDSLAGYLNDSVGWKIVGEELLRFTTQRPSF